MLRSGRTFLGATALAAVFASGCSEEKPAEFDERTGGGTGGMATGGGGSKAGGDTGGASGSAGSGTGGSAGAATGGSGATDTGGSAGSSAGTDTGGAGGSATGGSATGGSAGLEDCNALANTAELVTNVVVEDDPPMPPTPEGGTLVDGVYELTAVDAYDVTGTTTVESRRRTVELRYGGTIWDSVAELDSVVTRAQGFYEVVDHDLLATTLCTTGANLAPRSGYTASAERILTFTTDNLGRVTVNTFTRR